MYRKSHMILIMLSSLLACNEHPVERIDLVLNAVNRIENQLPAKTKLDFLFVIDNSNSMSEEQKRLAENFTAFSNFLFDELRNAADYRIAVVSTDIGVQKRGVQSGERPDRGRFLYKPTPADQELCCDIVDGEKRSFLPDTADCDPIGPTVQPIISSSEIESVDIASTWQNDERIQESCPNQDPTCVQKKLLEKEFRCRATLGTGGFLYEKGLESMRLALSCKGPNAEYFSACCERYGTSQAYYNPVCEIGPDDPEPQFLRPDATLVVIFITDEDDCSTYADFPDENPDRLICRNGGTQDDNMDGIPEIYTYKQYTRPICGEESPENCYQIECGPYSSPTECREERCDIKYTENIECNWDYKRLTRVESYKNFLQSLKARPLDQILVATIVGFRDYTDLGYELRYRRVEPSENIDPRCRDTDHPEYALVEGTELCCPEGVCSFATRAVRPSCPLSNKGLLAYPGTRYLQLAELLGQNGLGCKAGDEPTIDRVAETTSGGENCVNICEESFIKPLESIKNKVAKLLNTYCLDRIPACRIVETNPETMGVSERSCVGAELANTDNYALTVSMRCVKDECDEQLPLRNLSNNEWDLILNQGACPAQLVLKELPPANAEIFLDFPISVDNSVDSISQMSEVPNQQMSMPVGGSPSPMPNQPMMGGSVMSPPMGGMTTTNPTMGGSNTPPMGGGAGGSNASSGGAN